MEEASIRDETKEPSEQVLEERNLPQGMERRDEPMDTVLKQLDGKPTDESIVVIGDSFKPDDTTQNDLVGSIEQSANNGESNGALIVDHPNGSSIENAESTESFEFANGSDETSSWESFSGNDIEEAEAMVHQEDVPCKCNPCTQVSMAHSARLMERSTHTAAELPENVMKIETEDNSKIYVVGTAHFSTASIEDVSQTIQAVCPDVVMIELCNGRMGIIKYDEETLLREAKDISTAKIKLAMKESGIVGGIMQILLLSMSAHMTKELGMAPGGEFRQAVKEAKRIPGCQILLGDRPFQITLDRVMSALSFWQKLKMGWHLLTSRDPISKEDVEKFKQKDMLAEILKEMTGDYPILTKVFVTERDMYMAHVLRNAAKPITVVDENGEICGHEPAVVVGVVGLGHMDGIKENFGKDVDMVELLRVPSPSSSSKIIKYTFRSIMVAALSWGVFKLAKWTGVC